MPQRNRQPGDLEAIETASRDEIGVLQLERPKWILRHAYDNKVERVHASSGTTGKPTVVGHTRRDIDTWASVVARCTCSTSPRNSSVRAWTRPRAR